jgi:hypothetical protein
MNGYLELMDDVHAIDLTGYLKYKESIINDNPSKAGYNPVLPANSYGTLSWSAAVACHFNVSRLPQTHIYDVLRKNYSLDYGRLYSDNTVTLEVIVAKCRHNIVALSLGKGEPIATGLLIAPHLVLTARHCVEELQIKSLVVRRSYEKDSSGMNYGCCILTCGYVEENSELDYVILQLNQSVAPFEALKLNLSGELYDPSILIHHPNGGPKQVSVHAVPQSNHFHLNFNGYHDSQKGSSGGVYINASAEICALHIFRSPTGGAWTTSARKMGDLFNSSSILPELYDRNGVYRSRNFKLYRHSNSTLPSSPGLFHGWLERVTKPGSLAALNFTPGCVDLAYHHIIPIGDMEFLWMLGKENSHIESMLVTHKLYCPSKDAIKYEQLTINAVAWAPWNLIIGPSNRFDDPKDGNLMEQYKPERFPKDLWAAIERLYKSIRLAWDVKCKNKSVSSRTKMVAMLDEYDEKYSFPLGTLAKGPRLHQYAVSHKHILRGLKDINGILNKLKIKNPLYSYHPDEWVEASKSGKSQYALKGSIVRFGRKGWN